MMKASIHYQAPCKTVWLITQEKGPSYYATTYPDSGLVYLETIKCRQIAPGQATRLLPRVRDALGVATADGHNVEVTGGAK